MRPKIGVTVSRRSGWRIFPLMKLNVWLAGGDALRWQRSEQVDMAAVDGVIIGGGDDIAPAIYGGELVVQSRLDHERDALEADIVHKALGNGMPILGICRGSQMLNIAHNGNLDQNAYETFGVRNIKSILPRKRVRILDDTRLSEIAGQAPMQVNALHSQAVDRLGTDLQIAARDESGMIQAIERVREPFALGVQWHPEHLFYLKRQRALFHALVKAANAFRQAKAQNQAVDEAFSDEGS